MECPRCYGSGGGPDPELACPSCRGRGYIPSYGGDDAMPDPRDYDDVWEPMTMNDLPWLGGVERNYDVKE